MKLIISFCLTFLFLVSCGGNSKEKLQNDSAKEKQKILSNDTTNLNKQDKKLKISSKLVLTKHAQCKMDCRKINLEEIKEVISKGKINAKKSEPQKKPCPVLAIEGVTSRDKRKLRVVIAACKEESKIITVIDLNQKVDDISCKNCK